VRDPSLEARLDKLLVSRWITARWAQRIWLPRDLPVRLQNCIRNLAKGSAWCAYADDHEVYFVLGRMHQSLPPAGEPRLEAFFLDADATLLFTGTWKLDPSTGSERQELPRRRSAVASDALTMRRGMPELQ
jgi:hypothetical protein